MSNEIKDINNELIDIENMTNIWYNYIEVYKIMSKKKKKQNLSNRIFAYIMLFLAVAFSLTTVLSFVLR